MSARCISVQAACHRREGFHLGLWKLAAGEARLRAAAGCQGRAVPGKPDVEDAASSGGHGAGHGAGHRGGWLVDGAQRERRWAILAFSW